MEIIAEEKADVVITDIKMPVMDGVELVKRLSATDKKPKIIVLSGFDEYAYVRETMKLGAADYILKPVNKKALLELLEAMGKDIEAERIKEAERKTLAEKVPSGMEMLNCPERELKNRKIIEQAKEFIKKNYSHELSLKMVADHIYLNASYLSDIFKKETGTNFTDYLLGVRMGEAKRLLSQPQAKVYEIAEAVGYDDPTSFNRAFKRYVGISPTEYKKMAD